MGLTILKIVKLDLDILELFIAGNQDFSLTSTAITKALFPDLDRYDLIKKNSAINYHLKKLVKHNLLQFQADSKNTKHYTLNAENVHSGESKLSVNGITVDMGFAFLIESNEGSYLINFLDDC